MNAHRTTLTCGAKVTIAYQYLWDLVLLLEGLTQDRVEEIDWDRDGSPMVRVSRTLSAICRHDNHFKCDSSVYMNVEDMVSTRKGSMCTPGQLLAAVYTTPRPVFQFTFPGYRVCGQGARMFLVPYIGIRATRGHSLRPDHDLSVLWASQEELLLPLRHMSVCHGAACTAPPCMPGMTCKHRVA